MAITSFNTIHRKLVSDLEVHAVEGFLVEESLPTSHHNFLVKPRLHAACAGLALETFDFKLGSGGDFLVENR